MIQLRDYQKKAIDEIFDSITGNIEGREGLCPCVVAPTGSGKSLLIARFISDALYYWPDFKILLLTHQKELIEQDVKKLLDIEPEFDIGIYSASLKRKELEHRIIFASIQSIIVEKDNLAGAFDCILIDECHLINNKNEGQYQRFFETQPNALIIGFTATPFRMSQGRLVEDGNIFDYYIETIGILEMQKKGYLSRLTTKDTMTKIDTAGIKVVAGEFNQKELDERANRYETNQAIAEEIVRKLNYYDRHHCIVFCCSVNHAKNISCLLNDMDIPSVCVEGSMSKKERERNIELFTSGEARAICNVGVLTTGFDFPATDCIALIRPTKSTGLYLQMVGRGIRISPETDKENCLLLDFGNNVETHGPIGKPNVNILKKSKGKGQGLSPIKVCPSCLEVVERSVYVCPSCGYEFPIKSNLELASPRHLYYGDPNGDEESENTKKCYLVDSWNWLKSVGMKDPHYERWEVTYYCHNMASQIKEYLIIDDKVSPFIKKKANNRFHYYCSKFGMNWEDFIYCVGGVAYPVLVEAFMHEGPPVMIYVRKNDKGYTEITDIVTKKEYSRYSEAYRNEQEEILKKQKEIIGINEDSED